MISCPGPSPSPSAQATSALVSAASPGAPPPSSLVTRILTVRSPYNPPLPMPRPGHPPFGPVSPTLHAKGRPAVLAAPHARRGPGLLQFTRNARRPYAPDLGRLAHGAAVAHRARPPGGHRLRGGGHPPGLLRGHDRGHRRLRRGRVVAFGPGPG